MSQPFASSWKDLGKLSERLESEDKKNGIAICGPRPSRRGSDRATWNRALEAIVPLPETVRTQPSHDYTYGSRMMALNPDTTCLYRATIVSGGRCLVIVETPASLAAHLLVTNPDAKAQGVVIAYDGRHGSNNFSKALAAEVEKFVVGYGIEEGVTHGPLVSEAGQKKVEDHVNESVEKGVKVLVGGKRGEGLIFEPAVLVDLP
ncbi:hypothetical protein A4X06_0g5510 [Tilletia controversa]|uniref:Uncharacterized protein n=1 Tax=Tilletia controversa TaxID=13291 RepID=A0A8X7MQS4_9BASI|nr:hypothetical protein A4X06_0g5510 [Tilletia controversa]